MHALKTTVMGIATAASLAILPVEALAAPAAGAKGCCKVMSGAPVEVELVQAVGSRTQKAGDSFKLRLARPLIVHGRVVLRAGTPGVGEVVQSAEPGMGGKGGKLILAARYLQHGSTRIPLRGLQLAAAGRSNVTAASTAGLTGILFAPLGVASLAIRGGEASFPAGTHAVAELSDDTFLPSLGAASPAAIRAQQVRNDVESGAVAIPPPPAGQGQVVFYRHKALLSTGQWFDVREGGKRIGKLANGAYFIQVVSPGVHVYSASFEPEMKDHLTLEVAPGETYFVEGSTTKALLIGAADLSPSDRAHFEEVAARLKKESGGAETTEVRNDKDEATPARPAPEPVH